jgi:hypothetical protein
MNNEHIELGLYSHYKTGHLYKVVGLAKHSETLEDMVVYEAQYENKLGKLWVRPASMFTEMVEWQGKKVRRFEKVSDAVI